MFPDLNSPDQTMITWVQTTSAEIQKVTCDGQMYLRFNRTMNPPLESDNATYYREWLDGINTTVLDIYVVESSNTK